MKKLATKWEDLSVDTQKEYLRAHPASEKRIISHPGTDTAVALKEDIETKHTEIALEEKREQLKDRKELSGYTNKISDELKQTLPKRLLNSKKVQLSVKNITPEIEEAFNKLKEAGVDVTIEDVKEEVNLDEARDAVKDEFADATIDAAEKATGVNKSEAFKFGLRVFVKKAIPAAVFGFVDNFIMVIAGQFIDKTIAQQLHIGTMGAAGIGNTISDAVGAAGQDQIDNALEKIGLGKDDVKSLGNEKLEKKIKNIAGLAGSVFGITAGCLIGMLPLAFMKVGKTMKHIAKIQSEFLKRARKWDNLTLEEQKGYLSRHPKSKRRLTAKPGTKPTVTVAPKQKKKRVQKQKGLHQEAIDALEGLRFPESEGRDDEAIINRDNAGNISSINIGFRYLGRWIEREEDDDFASWAKESYQKYETLFKNWAIRQPWFNSETMKPIIHTGEKKWAYFGFKYRDPKKAKIMQNHLRAVVSNSLAAKNNRPEPISEEQFDKLLQKVKKISGSYYVTGSQFLEQKRDGSWRVDRAKLQAELDRY